MADGQSAQVAAEPAAGATAIGAADRPAPAPWAYTAAEKRLALGAVMTVLLLSALDQTIVSTAMPRIIEELRGLERYSWVGTAYLLTSTVTVPIYGKLGDIYGRRPVLIGGVIVFLIGSMLCGLAGEFGSLPLIGDGMNQLILCRAIQGIGGGALATGAFATVADLFPPAERGKYAGLFGAVFGLASVLGPLVGGLLTDHGTVTIGGHVISGWRWVFYVNLPLGLVALFVLVTKLPRVGGYDAGTVDWAGAGLVLASFTPLLLALSLGGHAYPWLSLPVLGLVAASLAGLAALLLVERRQANPIVPLDLFREPVFRRANLALFVVNMGFMGLVMFFPLYVQLVRGGTATEAGYALLPMMGGLLLGSISSGRIASRTRRYKPIMIVGGVLLLAGIVLLLGITPDMPKWELMLRLFVLGLGLGPMQGMFTLAIQSAVEPQRIGVATAASQFFRQIGSTVGVALFGALLINALVTELPARAPALTQVAAGADGRVDPSEAQALAMNPGVLAKRLEEAGLGAKVAETQAGLRTAFDRSIVGLFWVAGLFALIALIVILLIPNRELRGREPVPTHAE